jgi:lipopolysaccharide/colanic/teichoic acid biosynthesis glycosyltransferase
MRRATSKTQVMPPAIPRAASGATGSLVDLLMREGQMTGPGSPVLTAKRVVDCALAVIVAVLSAPVVLAAVALVRLTSRGPAIYTQERVGHGERRFTIYKIRTMIHDCESLTGPKWSVPGDPRVTTIGRVLRKLHIDELPQLLNVLRGEMSLVGPRPERPVFVAKLARKIPHYPARHAVVPGITGLAQLYLPPDIEVEDVERKLMFDLYYARHADIWMDIKILFCTALKVIGVPRHVICAALPLRAESLGMPATLAFPNDHPRTHAA